MTRAEIVQSLKDAWTRELMDAGDLRDDIADSYAAWVRGLVSAAAPSLAGQPAAQGDGGAAGGGGAAPAAGGGASPGGGMQ